MNGFWKLRELLLIKYTHSSHNIKIMLWLQWHHFFLLHNMCASEFMERAILKAQHSNESLHFYLLKEQFYYKDVRGENTARCI